MEDKNEGFLTKGTLLIILILFMFSSKLLDFTWEIAKSLVYLIFIIWGITYLNPAIGKKLREIINDFINIDFTSGVVQDIISNISSSVMSWFRSKKPIDEKPKTITPEIVSLKTSSTETVKKIDDLKLQENRNIPNIGESNNRRLDG